MNENAPRRGKTTIASDVLVTIARLSALSVPGVASMAPVPVAVDRLFQRSPRDGVRVEVRQMTLVVDLYLALEASSDVHQVCQQVQATVARALQEMVNMQALAVNVYVEDVQFDEAPRPA